VCVKTLNTSRRKLTTASKEREGEGRGGEEEERKGARGKKGEDSETQNSLSRAKMAMPQQARG
jgi:hypothetical protein